MPAKVVRRTVRRYSFAVIVLLAINFALSGPAFAEGKPKCSTEKVSANGNYPGTPFRTVAFNMKIRWCFDGDKVTEVSEPEVWGTATVTGKAAGWGYKPDGLVQSPREELYFTGPSMNIRAPWGYKFHVRGMFEDCPVKIQICIREMHPELTMSVYGDGKHLSSAFTP